MAKMMGPRFKMCRRLGLNVVGHPKAMKRADRGTSRADKKLSDYGIQLLEKQRLRAYYGVPEVQLKKAFLKAKKSKDQTGHALIKLLETRLDAFVLRAGFAQSIRQARQMVVHGHILVDGKRVDKPAYQLQVGQKVSLKEKSRSNEMFKENFQTVVGNSYPYIEKDIDKFEAVLARLPEREEIPIEIEDVYVVEYYSH